MDRSTDRLVYYSLAMVPGPAAAEAARQLVASVASLRRHSPRIPVCVLTFGALPESARRSLAELDADVREREGYAEHLASVGSPAMAEAMRFLPFLQKWTGLALLSDPLLSSVLYVDSDTVFLGPVERLFEAHASLDVYAREEPFSRSSHLGYRSDHIDQEALDRLAFQEDSHAPAPFNCGVVLMNHGSWRRIGAVSAEIARYAYRFALGLASLAPAPAHGRDVELLRARAGAAPAKAETPIVPPTENGWLKEQVALWLVLGKLPGLAVGTFTPAAVLQGKEYMLFDASALGSTLVHYYSSNAEHLRAHHPEWFAPPAATAPGPEAFFAALGDRIEAAFRETGYDEEQFPAIAERALRELPPADHIGETAVLTWLLGAPSIPRQTNIAYDFGQPAVVVYGTPRWYIEVIHWLDGTTNIHQHGFNGAFAVLAGSSLHTRYQFEPEKRYGARLARGKLCQTGAELLRPGDVRRIEAGGDFIHALFHLERPSLTVVVRTDHVPGDGPQYTFEKPGLAFDPFHEPELLVRKRQALQTLAAVAPAELPRALSGALAAADPFSLVALALAAASLVGQAELASALWPARARAGDLVDTVLEVVRQRRRRARLVALRSQLRAADHRFFLALLLNCDHAGEMRSLVRARHPHEEPDELLARWLSEMTAATDPDDPRRPVFEVAIDGALADLARTMIGGAPFDAAVRDLGRTYDAEDLRSQVDVLRDACAALRASELLAPLFRGAPPA